ncbi:hypothetical protein GGF31_001884 [Allomyces arbusculus]|nr:hypothetical protein GGF31_001884 [Allomyces arbusculus]
MAHQERDCWTGESNALYADMAMDYVDPYYNFGYAHADLTPTSFAEELALICSLFSQFDVLSSRSRYPRRVNMNNGSYSPND